MMQQATKNPEHSQGNPLEISEILSNVDGEDKLVKAYSALKKYEHLRITKEKDIPHPEPFLTIGSAVVAVAKNITAISAASKAGKTAVAGVILAGAISKTGFIDGFGEDFKVLPNENGLAVISFDTEQSDFDQQDNIKTMLRRADLKETPNYLQSYNLLELPLEEYKETTSSLCESAAEIFGGIHLILIDGGADYILSVNDEKESTEILTYFRQLSIKHKCPLILLVHQNPTLAGQQAKERGHFGSIVQRKCYGLIEIQRAGEISTISPKLFRKAGISDAPLISFKYCKEKGFHTSLEPGYIENNKHQAKISELQKLAARTLPQGGLTHTEFTKQIEEVATLAPRTAKLRISDMLTHEIVNKGKDGVYRLKI